MSQLTPLSKSLIGLIVVGAMASASWHLKLKDRFTAWQGDSAQPAPKAPQAPTAASSATPAPVAVVPPVATQPEKLEQAIQEPVKAAPATRSAIPKPVRTKPSQEPADPWADLNIDKKGNKQ
jgi:hypothetical protein